MQAGGMSGRAAQLTTLAPELFEAFGTDLVPLPPEPWFVSGPRGGLYVATGNRKRKINWGVDWMTGRDQVCVVDKSDGTKYLRPGSKLHQQAERATLR